MSEDCAVRLRMDDQLSMVQLAADRGDWATVAHALPDILTHSSNQPLDTATQHALLDLALHCLEESNFQVRWDIAKFIPQLGAIALPPLLEIVNTTEFDEEDWEYLWFAARLLGEFDHPDAIATLVALLQSDTPDLVLVASDALSNRGGLIIDALVHALAQQSSQPSARLGIVQTLAKIDHPDVIEPLLNLADDNQAEIQAIALEALMRFADVRIPPLFINALNHPFARVRQAAVTGLGIQAHRLPNQNLVPLIEPLLLDFNHQVSRQAAIALGRIGTIDALEALDRAWRSPYALELLQHDLIRVIGEVPQDYALSMLQTYLQTLLESTQLDSEHQERLYQTIVTTLGRTESPALQARATDILIETLRLPTAVVQRPQIRQAIAFSLGQLQNPQAVEALIQLLADDDIGVRLHAIAALKQIAPVDALERLQQLSQQASISPDLQRGTAFALTEWAQ